MWSIIWLIPVLSNLCNSSLWHSVLKEDVGLSGFLAINSGHMVVVTHNRKPVGVAWVVNGLLLGGRDLYIVDCIEMIIVKFED